MIRNYIKIALRTLWKYRTHTIINTVGLSVGVAAALLLFMVVRYELSFDTAYPDASRIYRVVRKQVYPNGSEEFTPGNPLPVADALRADIPQFEKIVPAFASLSPQVTVLGSNPNVATSATKFIEQKQGIAVDPDFFELFPFDWLIGQPSVLAEPNVVVLSRKQAEKYFTDYQQAVGKFLRINNQVTMRVVGVLADPPLNTDFPMHLVFSYASKRAHPDWFGFGQFDNWGSTSSSDQIFVRLPSHFSVASANNLLDRFSRKHYDGRKDNDRKTHFLSPLADQHYDARFENFGSKVIPRQRLYNMIMVGALVLLMACINFINIASALATKRAKEVGVRKVLGGYQRQLIAQFLAETFLVVLVSLVAGLGLAMLVLPLLSTQFDLPTEVPTYVQADIWLLLLGLLVLLPLLAGLYPAVVMASVEPLDVFRKRVAQSWLRGISLRGPSLRQVLIVAQFSAALVLLISMFINLRQMRYISQLDLGFVKEGVYNFGMDTEYRARYGTLRNELSRLPGVASVSFSSDLPSSDNNWGSNFAFTNLSKDEDFQCFMKMADGAYFDTFGMQFVAGASYAADDTLTRFVVNETMLKKLGVKNPASVIGKQLRMGSWEPAPIVGVVKDFHTNSAREAIKPMLIMPVRKYYWSGSVRLQSKNVTQTIGQIQQIYVRVFPEVAFKGEFYDKSLADYYQAERQMGLLYQLFAGLTIFIACLGLFGLATFMAEQRTKEIGVRKVLGASVSSIVTLLCKDFLKLVLIAIVIASPVAWWAMNRWLQDFAYKIDIEWWVFALAGLLAVGIALLTVSFQSVKAALMNPVKSLRSE